jgi:hypothetical protein
MQLAIMSLKVSDEYTVPLCATHHHQTHTTGKERDWWQERNIDPLKIASDLWQKTHGRYAAAREAAASAPPEFPNGQSEANVSATIESSAFRPQVSSNPPVSDKS